MLLTRVLAIQAPETCQEINILMIGIFGSGKSSLANTFQTVLRNSGQISSNCAVSGIYRESATKKVTTFLNLITVALHLDLSRR